VNDIVELVAKFLVSENANQWRIYIVEDYGHQVADQRFCEKVLVVICRLEESQKENRVGYLVVQYALVLLDVCHSLFDFAHIYCVFELHMAPQELNEEDSTSQSLVVVLLEPGQVGIGRDKEGHILRTVGPWNPLPITVGRVLLVETLFPFVVNLLLYERLVVKLVDQGHRLGLNGLGLEVRSLLLP